MSIESSLLPFFYILSHCKPHILPSKNKQKVLVFQNFEQDFCRRTFGFPCLMLFITCICHSSENLFNIFLVDKLFEIDCEVTKLNKWNFNFLVLFWVELASCITHHIPYSKLSSNFLMRSILPRRIFSHVSKRMVWTPYILNDGEAMLAVASQ